MKVKINCDSCGHVTELDQGKIPKQTVTFACPACKAKVRVDGAKIHAQAAPVPTAPEVQRAAAPESTGASSEMLEHLDIPESEALPSGLVIGDVTIEDELRKVMAPHGSTLRGCRNAEEARSLVSLALPEVMFFCAGQVGAPPIEEMQPILDLTPEERHKTFLVLIADNIKTMDGNAAFFHGVDLMLNRRDLGLAHKVLFSALQFRTRLCGPFLEAIAALEG